MSRGRRESQWLVVRRCLAIIRRAQRGPASRQELLEAVLAQEGAEAYGEDEGDARRLRLEKDLERIRQNLLVDLYHDREADGYVIRDCWLPLLDLPDDDLATIAWLEQTFGHDSPQHDEVHALLGHLRLYLAPERQGEIERRHTALVLDLGRRRIWTRQRRTERRVRHCRSPTSAHAHAAVGSCAAQDAWTLGGSTRGV